MKFRLPWPQLAGTIIVTVNDNLPLAGMVSGVEGSTFKMVTPGFETEMSVIVMAGEPVTLPMPMLIANVWPE